MPLTGSGNQVTAAPHAHATGDVANLVEYIQDQVAAFLFGGTGITLSYNDAAGQLTISAAAPDRPPPELQIVQWLADGEVTAEGLMSLALEHTDAKDRIEA